MSRFAAVSLSLLLTCAPAIAWADAASDALGEPYANGTPAERLVLLARARADKVLKYRDVSEAVAEIYLAYVAEGATAKERLERLGALRGDVAARVKELNEERAASKQRRVSSVEPDGAFQQAVALDYLRETAGPRPTLEALQCLALVRSATGWSATTKLVLSCVLEALARDQAFQEADHAGKLAIIKAQAEAHAMLSDHERTVIENAVLGEWMSRRLAEGATPEELSTELSALKDRKQMCFFSYSWANGILTKLTEVRARLAEEPQAAPR